MSNPIKKLLISAEAKRREFAVACGNFSEEYKDAFVLIADPHTDVIVMAHKGFMVPIRLKTKEGKRLHIVENALNYRKKENAVDQLLLAIDGGLEAIAKSLYNKRKQGIVGKIKEAMYKKAEESKPKELIESPFV